MGHDCCDTSCTAEKAKNPRYRNILWAALAINLTMFGVEILAGMSAGSVSLLADSLDFLGDAANYGISLWVLGMGIAVRAKASVLKSMSMAAFGVWVLVSTVWHATTGVIPLAQTMGIISGFALAANLSVAGLLYAYRDGDSNMRSVWLCTRNDALGNVAVAVAAFGVAHTGASWPDLLVALIMASLALSASWQVIRQARGEIALHHSTARKLS
jgi:Co/Zn/Cd efflux system component